MKLKMNTLLWSVIFVLVSVFVYAEPVSLETATKIANAQIRKSGKELTLKSIVPVTDVNQVSFYAAELSPAGFIIISADDNLPPVIGYSYQDRLYGNNGFFSMLKYDLSLRLANVKKLRAEKTETYKRQWSEMINGTKLGVLSQQWPPAGTTPTGGWLKTNWTQSSPYNLMCPMDPTTSSRSYTGCPATAMAQILNFHQETNGTAFTDADDYYHNYAGRTFWIDDDFDQHGFPSYLQLNAYLDTLNMHYQSNTTLTNNDKAALSFACGVAAKQVYTSEGSGTFSVTQAYDAYQRFGFTTSELVCDTDTSMYSRLAQNMKDTLPAHLALVDSSWSTGHNIVVDGYNTDNYFHVNFGWGGSNNGWYLLPAELPYSLTVVEGLILDINKNMTSVQELESVSPVSIYPNPAMDKVYIKSQSVCSVELYDMEGRLMMTTHAKEINISAYPQGVYFMKITCQNIAKTEKIIKLDKK